MTEGHPDKFCDQISDAVLDECLRHDPQARVACECYVTMGLLIVGGEVTTTALFDVGKVVRDVGNASQIERNEAGAPLRTKLRTLIRSKSL